MLLYTHFAHAIGLDEVLCESIAMMDIHGSLRRRHSICNRIGLETEHAKRTQGSHISRFSGCVTEPHLIRCKGHLNLYLAAVRQ